SPLSCSFSFSCSVDLLYLHSFPTRRSSDLYSRCAALLRSPRRIFDERKHMPGAFRVLMTSTTPSFFRLQIADVLDTWATEAGWRSEEHTSELQSRFDLVCRLLLEKKKKINN